MLTFHPNYKTIWCSDQWPWLLLSKICHWMRSKWQFHSLLNKAMKNRTWPSASMLKKEWEVKPNQVMTRVMKLSGQQESAHNVLVWHIMAAWFIHSSSITNGSHNSPQHEHSSTPLSSTSLDESLPPPSARLLHGVSGKKYLATSSLFVYIFWEIIYVSFLELTWVEKYCMVFSLVVPNNC